MEFLADAAVQVPALALVVFLVVKFLGYLEKAKDADRKEREADRAALAQLSDALQGLKSAVELDSETTRQLHNAIAYSQQQHRPPGQ